jgi:hypothetical protein
MNKAGRLWFLCVAAACAPEPVLPAPVAPLPYTFLRLAGPLPSPTDLAFLPDGTLLVTSLSGELTRLDADGGLLGATAVPGVITGGEQGLLAIAVDPLFGDGEHDAVYTWRTVEAESANALTRWTLALDPLALGDEVELFRVVKPSVVHSHNGGDLAWWEGPEGMRLALSVGDGDPKRETQISQDLGELAGKVLAVDPWAAAPEPEVLAAGLRNPWRMSRCGSALCVADVGLDAWEEVDVLVSGGENFGWPLHEGPTGAAGFVDPVVAWEHGLSTPCDGDPEGCDDLAGAGTRSSMVGPRVEGGALDGMLLFGDLYAGTLRGLPMSADGLAVGADVPLAHQALLSALAQSPEGQVLGVELLGTVRALVLTALAPSLGPPGMPLSSTSFSDGGVVYEPRHPLWSNGADKERLLQLPAGGVPAWTADGWVFPVGTRAWKTFALGGAPVETRLLEKQATGWASGTFVYQGDDAYLTDGRRVVVGSASGPYQVPGRSDCEACHAGAADHLLGLDPAQLGEAGLAALGAIDGEPTVPAAHADPVVEAARGWLYGNCAHCHHAGSPMGLTLDLAYTADPDLGAVGVASTRLYPGEVLIVPGDPEDSALIWALEDVAMPPLGVWEPDDDGIAAVRAYIDALGR